MKIRHGTSRTVFLTRRYAIKVPIIKVPWMWIGRVRGLLANIEENNIWQAYRKYPYEEGGKLCPVLWCSWGGWIIVMPRCKPYPYETISDEHRTTLTTDNKPENYGIFRGRFVCFDYA